MTPRPIIDVLLRCTAGILIGYALAAFFSIVFARILVVGWNQPLGDAVLIATMLGHLLYFAALILCFCHFGQRQIWGAILLILAALLMLHNLIPAP